MAKVGNGKGRSMDVCMARDLSTITGRVGNTRENTSATQPVTCGRRLKSDGTCRVHGTKTA